MNNGAIGIFDSGLGGLTVVREIEKQLPGESIIYFGDTGRVPYGTRSSETVAIYASQAEALLLRHNVKMIIAACGTVSSVAAHTGDSLPVKFMGVVDSAAAEAVRVTQNGRVGVIGTAATINSGAFARRIKAANGDIEVTGNECSLLVQLVENGWIDREDPVTRLTVERYLEPVRAAGVDTLILGCTHFPVLEGLIAYYMGAGCTLINTGRTTAAAAGEYLKQNDMLAQSPAGYKYFFTDKNAAFERTVRILMGRELGNTEFISVDSL